jgi:hypothetical protein
MVTDSNSLEQDINKAPQTAEMAETPVPQTAEPQTAEPQTAEPQTAAPQTAAPETAPPTALNESSKPARKGRRPDKEKPSSLAAVLTLISACPRCSFFVAGYRVIHADMETAVDNNSAGWLELSWDQPVRELLHKAYGVRIDVEAFYFSGSCRECRRSFTIQYPEEAGQPPSFSLQLRLA